MLPNPPEFVRQVTSLHRDMVVRWHGHDPDNPYTGLLAAICQQHQFNFLLWHEEDIARSPDASDKRIAEVKRSIDRYNQQRNDWIERIDEALMQLMAAESVLPQPGARLNTETPGSAVDRLSIMTLRIYHYEEQMARPDATRPHVAKVQERLDRCHVQHADLAQSLGELLEDLFTGRKRLKVYRQMKMYNDATLNPYLYEARRRAG
jgi:hypothetical protein